MNSPMPDVQKIPATVFIRTPDGRHVYINDVFIKEHGWSLEYVKTRTQLELFGEAARPWYLADQMTLASRTETRTIEGFTDHAGKRWQYVINKWLGKDAEGEEYLVGIGLRLKSSDNVGKAMELIQKYTDLINENLSHTRLVNGELVRDDNRE